MKVSNARQEKVGLNTIAKNFQEAKFLFLSQENVLEDQQAKERCVRSWKIHQTQVSSQATDFWLFP